MRMLPSLVSRSAVTTAPEAAESTAWCEHWPFGAYTMTPPTSLLQIAPDRSSRIGEESRPIELPAQIGLSVPARYRYSVSGVRTHNEPSRPPLRPEM